MSPLNKINTGVLISMVCWLVGFCHTFNWSLLYRVHENKAEIHMVVSPFIINLTNFQTIFINNLTVAIIIAFLGYLSFGLISIIGSLHNGFILAIHLNNFLVIYDSSLLCKVMIHAPTEFLAFCYFGAIGILGFGNFKNIFGNEEYNFFDCLPSFKFYIFPTFLLLISALIESDIFSTLINK